MSSMLLLVIVLPIAVLFSYPTNSNIEDIDASILDTLTELIDETPMMKYLTLSPKSVSRDVIKCLGIVTPELMPPPHQLITVLQYQYCFTTKRCLPY